MQNAFCRCVLSALSDTRSQILILQKQIGKSRGSESETTISSVTEDATRMSTVKGVSFTVQHVAVQVYNQYIAQHVAMVPWYFLFEEEVDKLLRGRSDKFEFRALCLCPSFFVSMPPCRSIVKSSMTGTLPDCTNDWLFTEDEYLSHLPHLFQELRDIFFSRLREKKRSFLSAAKGPITREVYDDLFPPSAPTDKPLNVSFHSS